MLKRVLLIVIALLGLVLITGASPKRVEIPTGACFVPNLNFISSLEQSMQVEIDAKDQMFFLSLTFQKVGQINNEAFLTILIDFMEPQTLLAGRLLEEIRGKPIVINAKELELYDMIECGVGI